MPAPNLFKRWLELASGGIPSDLPTCTAEAMFTYMPGERTFIYNHIWYEKLLQDEKWYFLAVVK